MSKVILRLQTPEETEKFYESLEFEGNNMSIKVTDREGATVLDSDQLGALCEALTEAGVSHTMLPVGEPS